ncbi:MAG: glycosyltransferase [Flavobacterium sp.]|nr:MAG: glycosyltransferase [Flavobacterium sp.]
MSETIEYSLSFILATSNRLTFLKITLEKLINNVETNEEIVVVDGASTDGTKEYLQQLYHEGKIHQFISEPDKNQAHGWNKAMLLARGTIIKKIIDDDVFCYTAIRKCKQYMLSNPSVDAIISNDLSSSTNNYKQIDKLSRLSQFEKWRDEQIPSFTFGDVHLLIRRNSISFIGLYNTSFVMMDWEYALRISYVKANLVYYTGYNALSVSHPGTVSANKNIKQIAEQGKRGSYFYQYMGDGADISIWSKIKIGLGKYILKRKKILNQKNDNKQNFETIYKSFYCYIDELNQNGQFTFLSSNDA